MSSSSPVNSLSEDIEENVGNLSWLATFYYKVHNNIFNMSPGFFCKDNEVKPRYFDMYFKFEFHRISELHFKIILHFLRADSSIRFGDYKLLIFCDINVFDEDTKVFEMHSDKPTAEASFWLNRSYKKMFSSSDIEKEVIVKILIKMIEFDCVSTERLLHYKKEFHKDNGLLYKRKTLLRDLCCVLNIKRFDDLFTGRQNWQSIALKISYIRRTVEKLEDIDKIMTSTTPPSTDLEHVLYYLLHGKEGRIDTEGLFTVYYDSHFLGLNFLIYLCRGCILYRLSACEITNVSDFNKYMADVLKASVHADDEYLFEKAARRLDASDENLWSSKTLLEELEKRNIDSSFVIKSLKRRWKKLESTFMDRNRSNRKIKNYH